MLGFLFETPSGSYRVINKGTEVVAVPREERYQHQVRGEYIGQREVIRFAAERGEEVKQVTAAARDHAIQKGNDDSDQDQIPLVYQQQEKFKQDFWIRKKGGKSGEYVKVNGSVRTAFNPTRSTIRPWGYLLPNSMAHIIPLLLDHEIMVKRLTQAVEVEVEVYYAKEIKHPEYFQGHYLKQVKAEKKIEKIKLPSGSFFVPAGQQKSNLICYILEPETNDNLITWGYLDNFLRVTTRSAEMIKQQEDRMQEYMSGMTEEQRKRMRQRMEQQAQRWANQRIPIYRLMKKTGLKGILVNPYNVYEKNQYIK